MQKKLIAIVVTLAMLLSTFGVVAPVFADGPVYKVEADEYILTATTNTVRVTVLKDDKANRDDLYYGVFEVGSNKRVAHGGPFSSGSFNVVINAADDHNEDYKIVIDDDVVDLVESAIPDGLASTTVTTKHDMSLTIPSIKIGDTKTITGTVKDGAGYSLEDRPYVYIVKSGDSRGDAIASTRAASNGSFALAAKFDKAGDYVVMLECPWIGGDDGDDNEIEYDEFEVAAKDTLSVKVNKSSVIRDRAEVIEVTVKDGSKPVIGADVEITLGDYEASGTTVDGGKVTITVKFPKAGTAKVTADKDGDYEGETTIKVVRPSSFNISLSDTEVDAVKELDLEVEFWDDDGDGIGENIEKVKITVEGCGIDEDATVDDESIPDNSYTFEGLLPECGGEILVTAVATMVDGDKVTKTEKIKVDGWVVTVTPETATYEDKYEFKAVVTKTDETPVNNAVVYLKVDNEDFDWDWDDVFNPDSINDYDADEYDDDDEDWIDFEEIDSSKTNINNGIYTRTVRFNEVGTAFVLVTKVDGTPMTYVKIDVEGEDVYDVDAPEQLVAGLKEDVEFTVKDEDGAYVKDSNAYVTIDGEDIELDRDGNVYSFSFVHDEAEELDLVFKTDNGEFIGKTTIEVLAPKLVLPNEDTKLTYMVEENWEVKLVDPRDDSVIEDAYLYITPDNCTLAIDGDKLADIGDDAEEFDIDMGDGEAEFDILAYEEDDDDEPMLLTFEVEIDDGPRVEVAEIEVVGMSITASPAAIGVDVVSTVTITVLDAHGKPYAEKDVELTGPLTAESETDENGQVTFKIKPVSTGKITVKVETDVKDEYAEGEIKVSLDAAGAGVITMQLGNKTAVANGSMSTLDVAPFAENGRTLVPFRYIAEAIGAYVEFIAPDKVCYRLRVDENTVDEVWLTIGSTVASVNGVEQTLEVAPKVVDGRTVVPLRFVGEAFGFYVDYNFGTEVITLTK
ncbi:MAG: stalk domain-containing protein [bacterium]|jgi:hypothetical protein